MDPTLFVGGDANLYVYVGGDPINRIDPNGHDWTDVAETTVQFLTGVGDSASLGLTSVARNMMGDGGAVNKCSPAYKAGEYAVMAASLARLAYVGTVRIGATLAENGEAATAFRNAAKQFFRGGDASKSASYVDLLAEKVTDSAVQDGAARTNALVNTATTAAGATAAEGKCGCQ